MTIIIVAVISALIVGIDQLIKYFVYENLHPDGNVTVIDNLFSLVYSENRGAAFGMFQDGTIVFSVITILLIGIFLYLIISKKFTGKLFTAAVTLIDLQFCRLLYNDRRIPFYSLYTVFT